MNGKSEVFELFIANTIDNRLKDLFGEKLNELDPRLRKILSKDKISEEEIRMLIDSIFINDDIINTIKNSLEQEQVELV